MKVLKEESSSGSTGQKTAAANSGDTELKKLKSLSYVPCAPVNPFPTQPDTMTDCMPKLYDLLGDKTRTALCKKANSSMKYEQMVLGPTLAYLYDAAVYAETALDLIQDLPMAEQTPFLNDLFSCMVSDSGLTKWLAEFDTFKTKVVMTTTARQAADTLNKQGRSDHRVGGRCGEAPARTPPHSPDKSAKGAKPERAKGDWCFSFDLKDGYHAVGINPDFQEFQEFMQFHIQGVLYQCGALPFGWMDSPQIFVKLMKTLMELIRSPRAEEDRHEVEKLKDGQEASYIRSEANEWAERLSQDKDLDDWRINDGRWFKYGEEHWGKHSVDHFASEISAQLPRYYSAWHNPGCKGVDTTGG
ncbi:hypothetical protein CYMTET_54220 [Cymbomonas tetramitiformis]|uniref:Reverse transcriptase domain-containing protein n=1 Tax=Cymbomonas tetramitiformis TaxID=36881 RepID=A0AAE0EPK2_9CHLO|nr:hypothetical protein CYMTET_54220 [Cymbomonas tetramitiformis]